MDHRSYQARKARGRIQTTITLSEEAYVLLLETSMRAGKTQSAIVEELIKRFAYSTQ